MLENLQPNNPNAAYGLTPPWDIGVPQSAMLALLDEFPPTSPALDVGCGTGTLALALAQRGLQTLGIDLASNAIAQAQAKASAADHAIRARIEFRVGDALDLSAFPGSFATITDTGFFHLFGAPERERFAQSLAVALKPGGRYYLLGFAFDSPIPNAPRQVTQDELRQLFSIERGWRILALRADKFIIRSPRGNEVPATAACIEQIG